ncbi:MAG: TetR/AcrR family transcriptional regulator [Flavitalea sp.]
MSIAERRIRQKEEVRTLILSTAWKIVKEEGWQSLSIRKIADAIEYSIPVIYDHFANKESILFEIGKDGFRLLSKKVKKASEKHDNAPDQIRSMADAYWNFAFKNKEYYQLMFGLGMPCCEEKCMEEKSGFRNLLMEPINEMIEKSGKKEINACLKYHTLWSVMHGLISIIMMSSSDLTNELNKMVLDDAVEGFIKNLEK